MLWRQEKGNMATMGLRERRKLPHWGPGQSPGQKWISWIFNVRKKPSETTFRYFEQWRGPQTSRGPRKLSLLSPLLDGTGYTRF